MPIPSLLSSGVIRLSRQRSTNGTGTFPQSPSGHSSTGAGYRLRMSGQGRRGWSGMVHAPVRGCLGGIRGFPEGVVKAWFMRRSSFDRLRMSGQGWENLKTQSFPIISALWEAFPGSGFSESVGISVNIFHPAEHGTPGEGAGRSGISQSRSSIICSLISIYAKCASGQGPKCHWASVFGFSIPQKVEETFRRTKGSCLSIGLARSREQTAEVSHLCGQHRESERPVTLTGMWTRQPRRNRCLSPLRGRQHSRRACLPRPLSRRAAP